MSLLNTFKNAAKTVFNVFVSLQKDGYYISNTHESGWDDSDEATSHHMKILPSNLTEKELRNIKFYSEIQPTDTLIMVLGEDIIANGIRVRKSDFFQINHSSYSQLYEIIGFDTDPAEALYIILLRERN